MKHIEGHYYLYCARCGYDWNVTEETTCRAGPYICPLCRRILMERRKRTEKK